MPFFILLSLSLLLLLWLIGAPWLLQRRRRQLGSQPFPAAWRRILRRRVPYVARLPPDLQRRLKKRIQVFVAEKDFVGCGGLEITDEVRVTVAAQACLLLLGDARGRFDNLREILVYPGAFRVDRTVTDGAGVLQEQRQVLTGESWSRGQVILSWEDVLAGAATTGDGRNVVIHEFAHQLDQEKGYASGAPYLRHGKTYESWSHVMSEAFERLQDDAQAGRPSLLSHYGATSPAEFFAVASEVFFEQAAALASEHPALYRHLCDYYGIDPSAW